MYRKEICFQRSWRFPRRGKGGDTETSLWKEGKASHGKLKNLYLMSYFSASDSVGRREAWAGILGICTGVLFHLFPVLPNSSHATVLPTMSAMEVCYWTKQFSWTDETSLDWKDMDDALHCEQFQIPVDFMLHPWYLPLFLESGHLASSLSIWFGSALFPCSVLIYYLSWLHIYSSLRSKMFRALRNRGWSLKVPSLYEVGYIMLRTLKAVK